MGQKPIWSKLDTSMASGCQCLGGKFWHEDFLSFIFLIISTFSALGLEKPIWVSVSRGDKFCLWILVGVGFFLGGNNAAMLVDGLYQSGNYYDNLYIWPHWWWCIDQASSGILISDLTLSQLGLDDPGSLVTWLLCMCDVCCWWLPQLSAINTRPGERESGPVHTHSLSWSGFPMLYLDSESLLDSFTHFFLVFCKK